jgi:multidrug resistance efflux pump
MTTLQSDRSKLRLRHTLYLLGVVLMIGSLLGAKLLTDGNGGGNEKNEQGRSNPEKLVGPVVMGTVDSDPQPIPYGLPPVLQSGTIVEKFVKDGDDVKAGTKLYRFDTSPLEQSLEVAKKGAEVTRKKLAEARIGLTLHHEHVKSLELAVKVAERNKEGRLEIYGLIERKLKDYYRTENKKITEEELKAKLDNEDKLLTAKVDYYKALSEWENQGRELETQKVAAERIAILIEQADAVVKQAEAEVAKAQKAIDLCTIYAKVDGKIEQVTIGEGATLGVSTLKPALWLIPAGPRIIRAEIEADFAHRVTSKLIGKEVTIYDNTDPKLTYKGKVMRISDTFLTKRSANETLLGTGTPILEAAIQVIDATPADRPPLRVGQRVRVDLGQ